MPYFSIVIPSYNRQRLIGRSIKSCLRQSFADFEVIVSDDGSTDCTVAVVKQSSDPRVRLLCSERNRGVGSARNAGADAAKGEWVVFLDSDDELLPGALKIMNCRAASLSPNIDRMVFMYRLDTGGSSPVPALKDEVWDYLGYLRWTESLRGSTDFNNCIRRRTFDVLRMAEDHSAEQEYHLEFASRFKTHAFPDFIGLVHSDAENRSLAASIDRPIQIADDNARSGDRLLSRHGASMAQFCPKRFRRLVRVVSIHHFLSGNRWKGWRTAGRLLRSSPFSLPLWILLASGFLRPGTLGRVMSWRQRRRLAGTTKVR